MINDISTYRDAPISAINLRIAMELFFPFCLKSTLDQYDKISTELDLFSKAYSYKISSMNEIECLCIKSIENIHIAAKVCSYEKNRLAKNISHAWILRVMLESEYREWNNAFAMDFHNMAQRLRFLNTKSKD